MPRRRRKTIRNLSAEMRPFAVALNELHSALRRMDSIVEWGEAEMLHNESLKKALVSALALHAEHHRLVTQEDGAPACLLNAPSTPRRGHTVARSRLPPPMPPTG